MFHVHPSKNGASCKHRAKSFPNVFSLSRHFWKESLSTWAKKEKKITEKCK